LGSVKPLKVTNKFGDRPNFFEIKSIAKPRMPNDQIGFEALLAKPKCLSKSGLPVENGCFITPQVGVTKFTLWFSTQLISRHLEMGNITCSPFLVLAKKNNFVINVC
tara:strand:- start:522 stop:842 length:321 start_codon:yes stop_codon:yes gene_type:complete